MTHCLTILRSVLRHKIRLCFKLRVNIIFHRHVFPVSLTHVINKFIEATFGIATCTHKKLTSIKKYPPTLCLSRIQSACHVADTMWHFSIDKLQCSYKESLWNSKRLVEYVLWILLLIKQSLITLHTVSLYCCCLAPILITLFMRLFLVFDVRGGDAVRSFAASKHEVTDQSSRDCGFPHTFVKSVSTSSSNSIALRHSLHTAPQTRRKPTKSRRHRLKLLTRESHSHPDFIWFRDCVILSLSLIVNL